MNMELEDSNAVTYTVDDNSESGQESWHVKFLWTLFKKTCKNASCLCVEKRKVAKHNAAVLTEDSGDLENPLNVPIKAGIVQPMNMELNDSNKLNNTVDNDDESKSWHVHFLWTIFKKTCQVKMQAI